VTEPAIEHATSAGGARIAFAGLGEGTPLVLVPCRATSGAVVGPEAGDST
jgi:hypothetical protein